jgi:hypothetical protein
MQSIGMLPFTILILAMILYFGGILLLTKGRRMYLGLILPSIFAFIALYNFIKPKLIPNPYPTMQEGIYMTFFGVLSILGFIVFGTIKYLSK